MSEFSLSRYAKSLLAAFLAFAATALLASAALPLQADAAVAYRYVAHQGKVNSKHPGNTVEAFKQAAATDGIWGIETDIWRTKDGKWVCIHGSGGTAASWQGMNVLTTNRSKLVAKKSPAGYKLPTFEQYLDACKSGGKVAVIELKDKRIASNAGWAKEIVKIVHSKGMIDKCMFISFQPKSIVAAKDSAKSLYKKNVMDSLIGKTITSKAEVDKKIATAKQYKLSGISCPAKFISYAAGKINGTGLHLRCSGDTEANARATAEKYTIQSFTTEFTPTKYTVTFKDGVDGKVLKTQKVLYAASASAPAAPSHAGRTFSGWSRAASNIKANTTITANYSLNKYTVTFKDGADGKVLKTQTVEYGKAASAPSAPAHAGKTFSGWSRTLTNITGNTTITANYAANKYTVTFKDGLDGKTIKTQTVEHGKAASAPTAPAHAGKAFSGWNRALTNITGNTTITANYAAAKYTVTFKDGVDGKTLKTQSVEHGKAASAPSAPAHAGRTFARWDKAYSNITAATTVTAIYNVNKYTVTFKDSYDGKVLKTEIVEHGKSATAPSSPSHAGKTFTSWSRSAANITANTTILANYGANNYNVTFKDGVDGSIIATSIVEHGKSASAPSAPSHNGYRFTGWDRSLGPLTGDATITALYARTASGDGLVSIRNAQVIDKSGAVMVSKKSSYAYNGGKPVCPVASLKVGGKIVGKDCVVCYYYKNSKKGTASVIIKGINSKGYKDSLLVSYKIR